MSLSWSGSPFRVCSFLWRMSIGLTSQKSWALLSNWCFSFTPGVSYAISKPFMCCLTSETSWNHRARVHATFFMLTKPVPCRQHYEILLPAQNRRRPTWTIAVAAPVCWPWGNSCLENLFLRVRNPFGVLRLASLLSNEFAFDKVEPLMDGVLLSSTFPMHL